MIRLKVEETSEIQLSFTGEESIPISLNEGSMFGGSDNYQVLKNKPQINGVTLTGNKTLSDVGINSISLSEIREMFKGW